MRCLQKAWSLQLRVAELLTPAAIPAKAVVNKQTEIVMENLNF
jgi:hypothetical protein